MLKFLQGDMRDFCGRSCFKRKLLSLSQWVWSTLGRILHAIRLQKSLWLWRSHKLWWQELSSSSPFIHRPSAQFFLVLIISALSRRHWSPLGSFSCKLMCIQCVCNAGIIQEGGAGCWTGTSTEAPSVRKALNSVEWSCVSPGTALSSCFRCLGLNLEASLGFFMAWLNQCLCSLISGGAEDCVRLQLKYLVMDLHSLSRGMACVLWQESRYPRYPCISSAVWGKQGWISQS